MRYESLVRSGGSGTGMLFVKFCVLVLVEVITPACGNRRTDEFIDFISLFCY